MRLDGLIFDVGDVFFDATPWRRWLAGRLRSLDVKITYEQLVEKWESLLVDVYCGRADYWTRFNQLLALVGLNGEQTQQVTAAAKAKAKEVQVGRELFEGVARTLEDLQADGVKLAVLSDTESDEKDARRMLRSLGIERYFDAVVTSRDIGHAKPAGEAYQAAVEALGVAPESCGFVGHDMDELAGAGEAGLCPIAYNCDPAAPADVYIERFSDLSNLVLANS